MGSDALATRRGLFQSTSPLLRTAEAVGAEAERNLTPQPDEPPLEACESDDFQLPILGFFADLETGCASVALTDEFAGCPAALQLTMIRDWQRGLKAWHLRALSQWMCELAVANPDLPAAALRARLAQACQAIGVDVALAVDMPQPRG